MKKGDQKQKKPVASLFFVPKIVDGELTKRIRESDRKISEILGNQCKIVEHLGIKLLQFLHKSNPWKNIKYGR